MEMHVIGVTEVGKLGDSDFTIAVFEIVNNPQVCAFIATDPDEKQGLQDRFRSRFSSFLLLNEAGLAELRKRDSTIDVLGQCNSAEITKRQVVAPTGDPRL